MEVISEKNFYIGLDCKEKGRKKKVSRKKPGDDKHLMTDRGRGAFGRRLKR